MPNSVFICLGTALTPGCGRKLTAEERRYYENSCETCTRADDERVRAWRTGGDDPDLDKMFDARPVLQ